MSFDEAATSKQFGYRTVHEYYRYVLYFKKCLSKNHFNALDLGLVRLIFHILKFQHFWSLLSMIQSQTARLFRISKLNRTLTLSWLQPNTGVI